MNSDCDVIIAGAGLAGASLAVGLAGTGRRVVVVEPVERGTGHQPSFDDRALALNAASLNILDGLDLLPAGLSIEPIRHIRVNRHGRPGHFRLDADTYGVDRFGAVVIARELGNALLSALTDRDGITLCCPDSVADFTLEPDRVVVALDSGQYLTGRLLVGSDGSASRVRRQAGIDTETFDYGQTAVVFNLRAPQLAGATAVERFTDGGAVALLPQPDRTGVVWIDTTGPAQRRLDVDDRTLLAELGALLGRDIGTLEQPGRRSAYPLRRIRAAALTAPRLVLLGNSATTVHPVSAQGFNLALRDVAALVDVLARAGDPGEADVLAAYADLRRGDHAATVRYTHTLARAFTNPSLPARLGTGLGLALHALSPALRRRLVHAAMGFRPPVSPLARMTGP